MYEDEDFEDDASVRSATSTRAASRQQKPVINATEGEEGYEDDYPEDVEHHEDYDDDFSAAEAQGPGSSPQVRASVSITAAKAALPSEQLEEASGGDYDEEDFEDTKSLISAARPSQKLSAPEGPAEDEEYDHDFEANPAATPKAAVPGPSKTQDYEDEFEENPQPVSSPTPEPGPVDNGTPFKSSLKPEDQDVMAPEAEPPVTVPTTEAQPPQEAAVRRRSTGTAQPPEAQGAEILAQDNGE
jgi:hypothetical protein